MRKYAILASVLGLGVIASAASVMAAPVTIFDGALENNFSFTQPAPRETLDSSFLYNGQSTVAIQPGGPYDQVGFGGGGSTPPVPSDATTLTMAANVSSAAGATSAAAVTAFIVQLATGNYPAVNFNDNNGIGMPGAPRWTIDGLPGTTTFTRDAWHVFTFDLPAAFADYAAANNVADPLVLDSTNLAGIYVQTNGEVPAQQSVTHLAATALVAVPEPASAGVLAMAGGLLIARRRKSIVR